MRKSSLKIIIWVIPFLLICGLGTGACYFFPLEFYALSNRFDLWKGGVTAVKKEGLSAYLKDSCLPSLPREKCACVALIHGLGDDAMTWKKILLWPEAQWKAAGLTKATKLVAVDLPGSGQSPRPQNPADYRVRSQAKRVQSFMTSLCQDWIVVGNSMGGWIATWMALESPQSVKGLVLLSPAGMKSIQQERNPDLLKEPSVTSLKEFQSRAYYKPRKISERLWKNIAQRAKQNPVKDILANQVEEDFIDKKISQLKTPTILIWGEEDRVIPSEVGHLMKASLASSVWKKVPQCGHMPQKECPAPVVEGIVQSINNSAEAGINNSN